MKASDILKLGVIAALAYFLYTQFKTNIAGPVSSTLANIWLSLTLPPTIQLLGNIQLPNGVLLPLQNSDVRQGPDGNVYLNLGGTFYQLQPSDANGNWPAVPVS